MAWQIKLTDTAKKDLKKLDRNTARRVFDYMERLGRTADPRNIGRALRGPLGDLWRYRVGGYRVICEIRDDTRRVHVLRVTRRDEAYRPR